MYLNNIVPANQIIEITFQMFSMFGSGMVELSIKRDGGN